MLFTLISSPDSIWFLTSDLQEILQVYFDAEFWGSELQRWREPSVPAQHYDGPEEVLQPSLPVPCGCSGKAAIISLVDYLISTLSPKSLKLNVGMEGEMKPRLFSTRYQPAKNGSPCLLVGNSKVERLKTTYYTFQVFLDFSSWYLDLNFVFIGGSCITQRFVWWQPTGEILRKIDAASENAEETQRWRTQGSHFLAGNSRTKYCVWAGSLAFIDRWPWNSENTTIHILAISMSVIGGIYS